MPRPLFRSEPVPASSHAGSGVTLGLAPAMLRVSIRAREAARVAVALGVRVPERIGETLGTIACLGPDEWLMRAPAETPLPRSADPLVALVDVSERSCAIVLEGPRALAVLSSGCPLDLAKMPVGDTTRTVFETVQVLITREEAQRFKVDVWKSFAPWLWGVLCKVADER